MPFTITKDDIGHNDSTRLPMIAADEQFTADVESQKNLSEILEHAEHLQGNPPTQATFILYRAIGNDLPPRHARDQTMSNIRFILEHEPSHKNLEKRWYINRIVNNSELCEIVSLLISHNQSFIIEPFNTTDYALIDYNIHPPSSEFGYDILRSHLFRDGSEFDSYSTLRSVTWDNIFLNQNQYIIRNNAARNAMIELGVESGAQYILPWDGNSFLNEAAWTNLSSIILHLTSSKITDKNSSDARDEVITAQLQGETRNFSLSTSYFYVPMTRLINNSLVVDPNYIPIDMEEEPQLIFHRSALGRFDENKPYGKRPKVDMLWRLGISGAWSQHAKIWPIPSWKTPMDLPKNTSVVAAGWTARLSSGKVLLEGPGMSHARGKSRTVGVERLAARAWRRVAEEMHQFSGAITMLLYSVKALDHMYSQSERKEMFKETFTENYTTGNNYSVQGPYTLLDNGLDLYVREARRATVNIIKAISKSTSNNDSYKHIGIAIDTVLKQSPQQAGAKVGSNNGNAVSTCAFLDAVRFANSSGVLSSDLLKKAATWVRSYLSAAEFGELSCVSSEVLLSNAAPFYASGTAGIRYELGAACCYAFLDEMTMLLRRTALARPRLWALSNISGIEDQEHQPLMFPAIRDVIPCLLLARVSNHIGINYWKYYGPENYNIETNGSARTTLLNSTEDSEISGNTGSNTGVDEALLVRLVRNAVQHTNLTMETVYDKSTHLNEDHEGMINESMLQWIIHEALCNAEDQLQLKPFLYEELQNRPALDFDLIDVRDLPPLWYATIATCK